MSSSLIVPVVEIRKIRLHPGADMLSIAEVLGYQVVNGLVKDPNGTIERCFVHGDGDEPKRDERGQPIACRPGDEEVLRTNGILTIRFSFRYKEGDKVVYFPADTVLTDEWAEKFEVKHLLKPGNRVGRTKLRGEPSFGLCVELPEGVDWKVGDNVADYYGATKWEPPTDKVVAPDAAPYDSDIDPFFPTYTDIESGWLLYEKFLSDEEIVATEKIHGKNCRIGLINGTTTQVGSRTYRKDPAKREDRLFWDAADLHNVRGLLDQIWNDHESFGFPKAIIVFGEIFGQGVQSLHYGCKKQKGFRAFDIYVDGNYLDYDTFVEQCKLAGVETAPPVYRGPFSLEKLKEISAGKSTLPGADHIREGVVVRPAVERRDPTLGRVVLKFISPDYDLSKHKDKDTTDV
ncbi:MAG: RNA ligase family protein [Nitrospiraceae bacterium]